ncbi:MAG: ATP-binding protein [Clostridium sp.]|nr:ATP-binding protein [Acetatifactor muris]MCM1526331.1 ATP-binding protein [Bacteroides sp.]MCM1562852.1 ATP-binding protein [Clostridium sp.]
MNWYPRENYLKKIRDFYHVTDIIKVITGVRRCGKSCLMETIADELKREGIPEKNVHFFDLDSKDYNKILKSDELEQLIQSVQEVKGTKYLFIDEVQNVDGFEIVLNGFRGIGEWSIFITGSNSYLLSGELMTKLTGRYIEFEMFPLSFEEYEDIKKFYGKEIAPDRQEELQNYILEGGFPRTINLNTMAAKRRYVQSVIDEIFEKDIRRRLKIRNKSTFETVQKYIINNFGTATSLKSLKKAIERSGTPISEITIARYIKALLDAKILCECPRFDMKSKKSLSGEKKYYLADLSFYYAQNTDNRINFGPVLENITYIYARSHDYSVSVGRIGKFECDFILRDNEMNYSYVQVSYTIAMSKETEDREYRALESIKDNYPKYVATVDSLLQQRNGIAHVNLVDFMKNGKEF